MVWYGCSCSSHCIQNPWSRKKEEKGTTDACQFLLPSHWPESSYVACHSFREVWDRQSWFWAQINVRIPLLRKEDRVDTEVRRRSVYHRTGKAFLLSRCGRLQRGPWCTEAPPVWRWSLFSHPSYLDWLMTCLGQQHAVEVRVVGEPFLSLGLKGPCSFSSCCSSNPAAARTTLGQPARGGEPKSRRSEALLLTAKPPPDTQTRPSRTRRPPAHTLSAEYRHVSKQTRANQHVREL